MDRNGKEFAEALFSLARENGQEKAFQDGLRHVRFTFLAYPIYKTLLEAPTIPQQEKEEMLEEAFGDTVPEEVLSAVQLLCRKGRIREVINMVREYNSLYRDFRGEIVVFVVSAVPLRPSQKRKVCRKIEKQTGKTVEAAYVVEPDILGGVRVIMEDLVLDDSLETRLQELKGAIHP